MKVDKNKWSKDERRRYARIKKNFILTYVDKNRPEDRYEITQLKNISLGGMCFVTSRELPKGTSIEVELKTPYLSDTTVLQGIVVGCNTKAPNMIYETRLKFDNLSTECEFLLNKLIEYFANDGSLET